MSADKLRKLKDLIGWLEAATEPSEQLDFAIDDWRGGHPGWSFTAPPRYTRLIDRALQLVPPHHLWQVKQGIEASAVVWMLETDYDERNPPMGYSTTFPAIALCIAALKAHAERIARTESASTHDVSGLTK